MAQLLLRATVASLHHAQHCLSVCDLWPGTLRTGVLLHAMLLLQILGKVGRVGDPIVVPLLLLLLLLLAVRGFAPAAEQSCSLQRCMR